MADRIVGICRFSFLGIGDWRLADPLRGGGEAAARAKVAARLYAPGRLAFRFRTFESLTLPSIRAQTDPDFRFIVLTSPDLPQPWMDRLVALCATTPQALLVISEAGDVNGALAAPLAQLAAEGDRLVQFRLDDDDCLPVNYITLLRRATLAMRRYHAFSFSLPRALLVTNYPGQGPRRHEFVASHHAAGLAVRPRSPAQTVFSFGHQAVASRFPALTDHEPFGSLQLKFAGHDSRPMDPGRNSALRPIDPAQFDRVMARWFPFVSPATIDALAGA